MKIITGISLTITLMIVMGTLSGMCYLYPNYAGLFVGFGFGVGFFSYAIQEWYNKQK